jgi:hypothetical protein
MIGAGISNAPANGLSPKNFEPVTRTFQPAAGHARMCSERSRILQATPSPISVAIDVPLTRTPLLCARARAGPS